MMARYRLDRFIAGEKVSQAGLIQNRDIVGSMDCRKRSPKLTFENGRNGAAAIFEDVVVNDQEPRGRNR